MIGNNIRERRKALNMTQKDLANKSELTRESIGNYERGDRTPDTTAITKIAAALNVSLNDLLGLNLTDDKEVREFLYDDNQNRLINILKIYGYKVFEEGNNFRIVKDDTVKELSESQFNNVELFIDEYINFVVNK